MRPLDKTEKQKKEQRGERERGGEDTRTVTADSEGGGRAANLPTSRPDMAQQAGCETLLSRISAMTEKKNFSFATVVELLTTFISCMKYQALAILGCIQLI